MTYQSPTVIAQRQRLVMALWRQGGEREIGLAMTVCQRLQLQPYRLDDGTDAYDTVWASAAREAVDEETDDFDCSPYTDGTSTFRLTITAQHLLDRHDSASKRVVSEPSEPACADGQNHDWQSPHEIVGGLEENPGVHGHGGGVVITEVCRHCGAYRITDTWAQDPSTGEQGLHTVEYREADERSLAWAHESCATE